MLNSGGVRDSLPAGLLSYRDLLKVQPFANTLGVVTLGGAELLDYLRVVARMTPGSGGFAQTAGLQWRIEGGELQQARIGGRPIDAARRYRLAISHFSARGGDGYPRLDQHPAYIDTGFNDAEVLRGYIAAHSPLKPADFEPAVWR